MKKIFVGFLALLSISFSVAAPSYAALSITSLTHGSDTADSTTYATASVTPSANNLILFIFYQRYGGGTASDPTGVTGNGLTWVKVTSMSSANLVARRISVWRAMGSSPTAGAITATLAAAQSNAAWDVIQVSGVDTSGTNGSGAVVQSATSSDPGPPTGGTSGSISLSAFGSANNAVIAAFHHFANEGTSPGSAFTEINDVQISENAAGFETEYKVNDNAPSASWTTSSDWLGGAIEVKQNSTGISVSNLTNGSDGTDAASYTTASITPSANALVFLSVAIRRASGAPTAPTISGNGLTWVEVKTQLSTAGNRRVSVYRALGASPTTGAITITCSETQTVAVWSVDQFTAVDTSGTNGSGAVVQSVSANDGGSNNTTYTLNLAAVSSSDNVTYGVTAVTGEYNFTPGSGFTELADVKVTGENACLETEYKLNSATTSASWASTDSFFVIGAEVTGAATVVTSNSSMAGNVIDSGA